MALTGALSGVPHPENPDAIEEGTPKRGPGPSEFTDVEEIDLLDPQLDEKKKAKHVVEDWIEQDPLHSLSNAQARANRARRAGHLNVKVVKAKDEDRFEEWIWGAAIPTMNKAATNCRKAAANLTADPFVPDPLPPSSDPEDIDAAEFSARVLENILGEANLDDINRGREAFDIASDSASCFRYLRVDRHGRRQALQIEAHAQAVDANQPFSIPVPRVNPLTRQPELDPATGQPAVDMVEQPGPFVIRYVTKDGQLSDKRKDAKMEWVPKIVDELLPAAQVRFIPATATYIDKAEAVIIGGFLSISEIKKLVGPEKWEAEMTPDRVASMLKYRPERIDDFLPGRGKMERTALEHLKGDNRLVFCLTEIWKSCDKYPLGCYICVAGAEVVLHADAWSAEMEDGTEEPLDIPLAQYLQFREGTQTKDGVALMTIMGPGNEIRGAMFATWLEYLDRLNRRKTFIPTSSIVRPNDLDNPDKTYVSVNPGGVPSTEEIPEYPKLAGDIHDRAGDDMDHASGLEAAAQGLEDPSVQSGKHAQTIITQVHAGLSELRENYIRAELRTCRIILQLVRAFYTKPQQLTFEGKDGRTRQRRWSRADLGDTKDVKLMPATMTMMSPAAKMQFVNELVAAGMLTPDEARELTASGLAKTLGWKDEPHRLRIKRQIADWEEGPPDGWVPAEPQKSVDPATGQATLVPGQDPAQMAIWEPRLCDELPEVSQVRLVELARFMASTAYERWPAPWRTGIDQEFQHMSGILQQQAAAQAQAEAAASGQGGGKPGQGGGK